MYVSEAIIWSFTSPSMLELCLGLCGLFEMYILVSEGFLTLFIGIIRYNKKPWSYGVTHASRHAITFTRTLTHTDTRSHRHTHAQMQKAHRNTNTHTDTQAYTYNSRSKPSPLHRLISWQTSRWASVRNRNLQVYTPIRREGDVL